MKLTGKAKEDFLKWVKKRCNIKIHELIKIEMWFDIQDDAFKNALIIEWFDSVGIYIIIKKTVDIYWLYDIQYQNSNINISVFEPMQESRREAIKQAIIKANEIYNDRTSKQQ